MPFAFPPIVSSLAIRGSTKRFPVRRVFCVAQNYAAHAAEIRTMLEKAGAGGAVMKPAPSAAGGAKKAVPRIFMKPADAVTEQTAVPYAALTSNLQHEVELVVAIGAPSAPMGCGRPLTSEEAMRLVYGYAVGIDFTRRDVQTELKAAAAPWEWGKAFDYSAPIGPIHLAGDVAAAPVPDKGRIWLTVNGEMKQQGDLGDVIHTVPDLISFISESCALAPGDLIMTGTPSGVGAVKPGDVVQCGIDGLESVLEVRMTDAMKL
jgi:fumarylpyruvate hydrolase